MEIFKNKKNTNNLQYPPTILKNEENNKNITDLNEKFEPKQKIFEKKDEIFIKNDETIINPKIDKIEDIKPKKVLNPFIAEKRNNASKNQTLIETKSNLYENQNITTQNTSNQNKKPNETKNINPPTPSQIKSKVTDYNIPKNFSPFENFTQKSTTRNESNIKKSIINSKSEIMDYKTQKELDELIALNYYKEEMNLHSKQDEEKAKIIYSEQEAGISQSYINNIQKKELENQLAYDEYFAVELKKKGFLF